MCKFVIVQAVSWLLMVGCLPMRANAQQTENKAPAEQIDTRAKTKSVESSQKNASDLQSMKWLAGHWRGKGLGGDFEETWNPPSAGSMVGMFKLVKGGEVVFYELMTISELDGKLVLQVKHFGPKLIGWESKEDSEKFVLKRVTPNEIVFDGLSFAKQAKGKTPIEKVSSDQLQIRVRARDSQGNLTELVFNCSRKSSVN